MNSFDCYLKYKKILDTIDNGPIDEFIEFAKNYNIFQQSNNKFYKMMCDKIKTRLDKEGLDYNIVKVE